MNEFEVLSVHDVDFVNDKNERVIGRQLWLGCPTAEPPWYGYEVSKVWIPVDHGLYEDVGLLRNGNRIGIQFNRKGKPERIDLLE